MSRGMSGGRKKKGEKMIDKNKTKKIPCFLFFRRFILNLLELFDVLSLKCDLQMYMLLGCCYRIRGSLALDRLPVIIPVIMRLVLLRCSASSHLSSHFGSGWIHACSICSRFFPLCVCLTGRAATKPRVAANQAASPTVSQWGATI